MRARSIGHRPRPAGPVAGRERGAVGGLEVLPFGVLIFVVGSLLVVNAWAVIDAKLAVTSAAREAARTYVESTSEDAGASAADRAADDAISSYGRDPGKLDLSYDPNGSFTRCQRVTFTATYRIRPIRLPWGVGFGSTIAVQGRHSEIIDPLRDGLPVDNQCGY